MNVFRKIWKWFEDRTGLGAFIGPIAQHPIPPRSRWWYVFGSATLFAFAVQVVTGIALATVYVPSGGQAYESLRSITQDVPWGRLVRGMHYFGASAMVLFIGVHLMRVFWMAAYKFPREMNWLTGAVLLFFTIVMGFIGQVLRWSQNAVWSAVVGAEQAARVPLIGEWLARVLLSGQSVNSATLSHYFVLHVFILPGSMILLIGAHLALVIRNGITEPPRPEDAVDPATCRQVYEDLLAREGVPFWPYGACRDAIFGVAVVLGVVVLAIIYGPPPIGLPPDPSNLHATPTPDWYLFWYFAILALLPRGAENAFMILAPLFLAVVIVALPFVAPYGARSWRRRPWAPIMVLFVVTCIIVLWRAGVREDWSPHFTVTPLTDAAIGTTSGLVHDGAALFYSKGCLYCHAVGDQGGKRGPNMIDAGDRLTRDEITIRMMNGGNGMPSYAANLTPTQSEALVTFLLSRRTQGPAR